MSKSINEILEAISQMSIEDAVKLVEEMEEKFGVSANAIAQSAGPVAPAAGEQQGQAEQTEFAVHMSETGSNKIKVIQAIRSITNLGLKEAKELVESAPVVVKEGIPKDDANKIKEQLEQVGAKVEIK